MAGAELFLYSVGETGCLLIHGFTGSPDGVRRMGEHLAAAGITALDVLLQGQGTDVSEMDHCSHRDWVASAEAGLQELRRHCCTVFVAGISMGGVITLRLAGRHQQEIAGAIAMATPYNMLLWMKLLVPPLKHEIKRIPMDRPGIRDLTVAEVNYRWASLPSVHELLNLIDEVRPELPLVTCPVLLITSRHDRVVNAKNVPCILVALGSSDKELIWVERSDHGITLDYDKELVLQRAADFIKAKTPERIP